MLISKPAILQKYVAAGQEHVFRFFDELSSEQQQLFLMQLERINLQDLQEILKAMQPEVKGEAGKISAANVLRIPKTEKERKQYEAAHELGVQLIKEGKVACFVVAGGQGSRLGYEGPKGAFNVELPSGKTLFELQADQILAASKYYGVDIPWYIMTSETNHKETIDFFEKHSYFSFKPNLIQFFSQEMLPAVDKNGKLILAEKNQLFLSPNGHGGSLLALERSGALRDMEKRGILYLSYYQVDNILIDIIDPSFIGMHVLQSSEFSFKMVQKRNAEEKVGVVARRLNKLEVIEYSDLPKEEMFMKNEDGNLKFWAGSIAIHLFSVKFIKTIVAQGFKLPYHVAEKSIPYINERGEKIQTKEKNGIKFETFVFDAVQFTPNVLLMEVEREEEFGPVKNKEGEDSPITARNLYMEKCRRRLMACLTKESSKERLKSAELVEVSPLKAYSKSCYQRLAKEIDNQEMSKFCFF